MKRKGFTLIELLVVIAIIAILAAILFPVFAQAREKARSIACLSNLKQIGIAVVQYNQDYDEKMPAGIDQYGSGRGWAGQIYAYIKSAGAFHCPDDALVGGHASSYGLNANYTISSNGVGAPDGTPLSAFNSPTKTVMLFEVANSTGYDLTSQAGAPNFAAGGGQGGYVNGYGNSDNGYQGGSPAGNGVGGSSYDPNGTNTGTGPAATTTNTLKYATGYIRYSDPDTNGGGAAYTGNFTGKDGRHQMGANYLMSDTHAKFLRPNSVTAGQSYAPTNQYYLCGGSYNSGTGANAATVECNDPTVVATFNVQ